MDQASLESALADLNIPDLRYFPSTGSTNDEALHWISEGAQDRSLVIADEQTAGRGRLQRRWITSPEAGLAFSVILRIPSLHHQYVPRLTGLGAVAVRDTFAEHYSLPAMIKWPNDILINQGKAAGVLAESVWEAEKFKAAIIGIGINIASSSVDAAQLLPGGLRFPATSLEGELGHCIDRTECLHAVLKEMFAWLSRLAQPDFIREWESKLAFRGQWVVLSVAHQEGASILNGEDQSTVEGKLVGLAEDGSLRLLSRDGQEILTSIGEIRLVTTEKD